MAVETALNVELARHLRGHGLNARGEVRLSGRGRGQADVLIQMPPHRIIIKAKRGRTVTGAYRRVVPEHAPDFALDLNVGD